MTTFRMTISVSLACIAIIAATSSSRSDTASCRASCYSYSSDPAMCLMSCPADTDESGPSFGAIYISGNTGASGLSVGFSSRSAAERQARRICETRSGQTGDCEHAIWFDRTCAALAVGRNKAWGARFETSLSHAARQALTTCRAKGGVDCRVVESQCSN